MVPKTFLSKSSQETKNLGRKFAKRLKVKTIFLLKGNLGSGKTTFIQGLAKSLGIKKRIISPTFILVRNYQKSFYHIDLYRVKDDKELENLGLKEILESSNSIVAIEWAEKLERYLTKLNLKKTKILYLEFKTLEGNHREITVKDYGQ